MMALLELLTQIYIVLMSVMIMVFTIQVFGTFANALVRSWARELYEKVGINKSDWSDGC